MPGRTVMSRRAFLAATDRLIADGERLTTDPDWNLFRVWLLNSDELLERVWGRMDRYHRFVTEVASAKLAVLRTMRTSVEARGWSLLSDDDEEVG